MSEERERVGILEKKKGLKVPPALIAGSNRLFQVLDLYWHSPESGELWYKSRRLKKTI